MTINVRFRDPLTGVVSAGSTITVTFGAARDGDKGKDGHSPFIGEGDTWWEWSDEADGYVDTGKRATPRDGYTKDQVYSKEEIDAIIGDLNAILDDINGEVI